ncbi:TonB-dependent receptor plug domain-containing protein [Marinicella litoralis]|uniref:Hemoglobin/transferrin/lactoferrin receptor protein n=1 Tax=Marinicella litoralis TaxID=644220 RepID=A0A4R6XTT5_9GAMM|nr:TonB-dependent hemoglobin/transferrin/lactoferrin family receptor [Marinicella litoralis]TDR23385.1 hemoglobin/transferrin/lactoferrin receptor protein [Marinicella litoralis]
MKKILILSLLGTLTSVAVAEETLTDLTELDDMVVVAYKQARPVQDVIGHVSVISAEQMAETISQDMASAIKYEANVNIEDAGTRFGTSGINIRGMGDNRVAIEVDGIPNAKTFDLGSYSFATAGFPEIDLIQNIEILKGPASTLYGSDALGGIVAINTWDPDVLLAQNPNSDDNWTKLRLGFDGKRHGRFATLSSAWDFDTQSLLLSATQRDGKGVVNENSSLLKDTADWDAQSVFGKWKIDLAEGNSMTLGFLATQKDQFTQINSFIGQGRFIRTTALSGDDEASDHKLSLDYDFLVNGSLADEGSVVIFHAKTQFEQNTFENRFSRRGIPQFQYRQFNFDSRRTGLEINFIKSLSTVNTQHQLIYGFEWTQSAVEESRDASETNLITGVSTNVVLGENFPLRDFPKTDLQELGVFIHDEITFNDSKWAWVPAIRFDHYDLSPNRDSLFDNGAGDAEVVSIRASDFSPKLGVMYDVNEAINLYAQYVRGFRAPPYDDVNIGFNLALFNYQAIPNPDLKSETSDGFELGFRYSGDAQQINFNVFHNDYNNLIVSRDLIGLDPATDALIFQSRNINDAKIYGAELDYQWQINEQWSTAWQLAWTRGENKLTDQPLNHISPPKATANLQWQSTNQLWQLGLYGVFSQAQNRLDDADEYFQTPGFATFDLILGYQLSDNAALRIGLNNLTDKKYWLWQQVRNFEPSDPIIEAMAQASRYLRVSYSVEW